MNEGYNFKRLNQEILLRSSSTHWETARLEWALIDIVEADEPEACLCGHYPIIEICVIRNRITKRTAEVGNVCVKKFLGIRSDLIFVALERVRKNGEKSLNDKSIKFFYEKRLLNDWEYQFLQNSKNLRNLTEKQLEKRRQINKKVIDAVSRKGIQAL